VLHTLQTLATRRSQKTAAIRTLVQTAMPWCVVEPYSPVAAPTKREEEFRNKLVEALRDISDGKIFLERERAVLTRVLATIKVPYPYYCTSFVFLFALRTARTAEIAKAYEFVLISRVFLLYCIVLYCIVLIMQEQEGDVGEAANVLQEVHVETYGSLSKRDKVEFILEQLRLTLAKRDYVRSAVVAAKISKKHLAEESMEEYKVRFYTLMAEFHRHDRNAFELAKDYHSIYLTPHVLADESKWMPALEATVVFLALSPYGNEQQDLMHRINKDPNLEKLPACQ